MKVFCLFWRLFFQNKNCWHIAFLMSQIFAQSSIKFEKLRFKANYRWNYLPSKLPLHFIEYRLDKLNNKHGKRAVNSTMQYFESHCQNKCLLKVWSFLGYPPQNKGLGKIFAKLNETIYHYHTFGLMKMHNMSRNLICQ